MNDKQFQKLLDDTAKAQQKYDALQRKVNDESIRRFGAAPSDVDADFIIDSLFGGCGAGTEITVARFEQEMNNSIK